MSCAIHLSNLQECWVPREDGMLTVGGVLSSPFSPAFITQPPLRRQAMSRGAFLRSVTGGGEGASMADLRPS